jgi:hypothetical protein
MLPEDMDIETIDWEAEWDSSLSEEENFTMLKDRFGGVAEFSNAEAKRELQKHMDSVKEQIKERQEQDEEKYRETLKEIQKDSKMLHPEFEIVRELLQALLKSDSTHSLILISPAGTGKTKCIASLLSEHGLEFEKDYALVSGHITPLKLYEKMYRFKEGLLFVDDVHAVFQSQECKSLLLDACQTENVRIVQYDSTSRLIERLGLPEKFIFKGKVVFCTNVLPDDARTLALKSRSYYKEIKLGYKEKIGMIEALADRMQYSKEIVEFIKENTNESYGELSLRTLVQVNDWYKSCSNWKAVALNTFGFMKDEELELIRMWEQSGLSIKRQVKEWFDATGKSRASFYRCKAKLKV